MFINRVELLPEDESTAEHAGAMRQEAQKVEDDKKDKDLGLFQGAFKGAEIGRTRRFAPIVDTEDRVNRCPNCTWELEGGMCNQCGYNDSDDDDFSDEDMEQHMFDDTDEEDEEDDDGMNSLDGFIEHDAEQVSINEPGRFAQGQWAEPMNGHRQFHGLGSDVEEGLLQQSDDDSTDYDRNPSEVDDAHDQHMAALDQIEQRTGHPFDESWRAPRLRRPIPMPRERSSSGLSGDSGSTVTQNAASNPIPISDDDSSETSDSDASEGTITHEQGLAATTRNNLQRDIGRRARRRIESEEDDSSESEAATTTTGTSISSDEEDDDDESSDNSNLSSGPTVMIPAPTRATYRPHRVVLDDSDKEEPYSEPISEPAVPVLSPPPRPSRERNAHMQAQRARRGDSAANGSRRRNRGRPSARNS